MDHRFSAAELEKKTIEELRAMLADDTLLPLDDDSNTDAILYILELIKAKERKPDERREAERVAFWAGLLVRHGDKIPVRLEDIVNKRKRARLMRKSETTYNRRHYGPRKAGRRLAFVAALAAVLLVCNAFVAFAFNFNFLKTLISFTDDLFIKTIVSTGRSENQNDSSQPGDITKSAALQSTLDELGINRPQAPTRLPDGFEFVSIQTAERKDYVIVAALYQNGEKAITVNIHSFTDVSSGRTGYIEKNAGTPEIYSLYGMDVYIFGNMDKTVATWVDGMCDCSVQGDISAEELKSIIDSMYKNT